jgi:hypothetical protein
VDVDETRSDDHVARVDHAHRPTSGDRADLRDPAAGDRDVRAHGRRARAIDDHAAAYEKVGHRRRRSRPAPRSRRRATMSSLRELSVASDPS